VVATEVYDEQNDPDETVNIAATKEGRDVVERLSPFLPPPNPPHASARRNARTARP
jgi:hypothetical protein